MKTIKLTTAVAICLLVAGCSSFTWKAPAGMQKSDLGPETGLAVISTWADQKSISQASEIVLKRVSDGKVVAGAPIDNYALKSHFQEGWGFLSAFQLPPGEYAITLHAVNPFRGYVEPRQSLRFTVRGGEASYLGEAYYYKEGGYGKLRMRDRMTRDIPMFVSSNPSFTAADFVVRLPSVRE